MCYVVYEDKWLTLPGPEPHTFDGLESMLHHLDALYLLVSRSEDMYGYMHTTQEKKYFWRYSLKAGEWERLPPPVRVKGNSRLVSHVNGIYVIDRGGVIEEYNCDTNEWNVSCKNPLFDLPSATWYVLPMPVDRYIYLLRAYSDGYSFSYAQLSFKLYKFDTVHRTCENLSDIDSGDIDLEGHERLHGYTARPGKLTLKNELGESRLRFHFQDRTWSTRKPRIHLPRFIAEVWGAAEWNERVFFVCKTKQDKTTFMMYDYSRGRFKSTAEPPAEASGLECHVSMPKGTLHRLANTLECDSSQSEASEQEMSDSG